MKKLTRINYKLTDMTSHHKLILLASLDELIEKLGQPSYIGSGDDKVQLHWVFYDEHGTITIYDYKQRKPIYNIQEWNIGSKGFAVDSIVEFFESKNLKYHLAKTVVEGFSVQREKLFV